jgi:hypothetical protein
MKKATVVNKYKIVENFLPLDIFKEVQKIITFELSYFYKKGNGSLKKDDLYHFVHFLYFENTIRSNFFEKLLTPIMTRIDHTSIIRAKVNCYPSTETQYTHAKHQDYPFPHKGLIFHINNNNGYTILEDGTKIESIENRAVFFDTSKLHQSTTCTDKHLRLNININYV